MRERESPSGLRSSGLRGLLGPGGFRKPKPPPLQAVGEEHQHKEDGLAAQALQNPLADAPAKLTAFGDNLRLCPLQVVDWSSQRDDRSCAAINVEGSTDSWCSIEGPPQWLILDLGCVVEPCALEMMLNRSQADPRDIALYSSHPKDSIEGPWALVARFQVAGGPKMKRESVKLEFRSENYRARYWKLLIQGNWGAHWGVRIRGPLRVWAASKDEEQLRVYNGLRSMGVEMADRLKSLVSYFHESENLTQQERDLRSFARKHEIPLVEAEEILMQFNKFDQDGSRQLDWPEFKELMRGMLAVRGSQGNEDIPEHRYIHFWRELDADKSERVDFEEFLVWYHRLFYSDPAPSKHNRKVTVSPVERFYAHHGENRLGPARRERDRQNNEQLKQQARLKNKAEGLRARMRRKVRDEMQDFDYRRGSIIRRNSSIVGK